MDEFINFRQCSLNHYEYLIIYLVNQLHIIRLYSRQINDRYMGNFFYSYPEEKPVIPVIDVVNKKKQEEDKAIAECIQAEKITNQLNENIQMFHHKQAKYEGKIENLKKKAKLLLEQDKKKEAKKILQEVARLQKHLSDIQLRRKVIAAKKDQLEVHQMNKQAVDALSEANKITIDSNLSSKLSDEIISMNENKAEQELISNQFQSMVEDDQVNDAVDELFNNLQKEVKGKNIQEANLFKRQVSVNIGQKNVEKNKASNEMQQLLNNL